MPETSDRDPPAGTENPPLEPPAPDAREREATELAAFRRQYSRASSHNRPRLDAPSRDPKTPLGRLTYRLGKFWGRQVSVIVPHESCRDHLALERTFLGYLRTSLTLSMLGITIAQLFRLQNAPDPSSTFGLYVLGKPLSCICQGAAIFTLILGATRTWRLQNAIVRGKAISGGYELVSIAAGMLIVLLVLFALVIAVDVEKQDVTSNTALLKNTVR